MKTKPGITDTDAACQVHVTSAMNPSMPDATFTNMERHVNLPLQAGRKKFIIFCNLT
jgi:hypothetical protein